MMVLDVEFRSKLKKMLDGNADDHEIIKYVLEFAIDQYPRPTMVWIMKQARKWDWF